jgi:hypothetical protein
MSSKLGRTKVLLLLAVVVSLAAIYQILFTPLFYKLMGEEDYLFREQTPIVVEKYWGHSALRPHANDTPQRQTSDPNSLATTPLSRKEWVKRLQYWNNAGNQAKTPLPSNGKYMTWTPWEAGLNNRYNAMGRRNCLFAI